MTIFENIILINILDENQNYESGIWSFDRKKLPVIDTPLEVTSIRIWFCKYKDISNISECKNLKKLEIAGYPYDTLDILLSFPNLKELMLLDIRKVTDIGPLSQLTQLQYIGLHTPPNWDISGKKHYIQSLEPLSELKKLKEIELFGVLPMGDISHELSFIEHIAKKKLSQYPKKK